MRIKGLLGTVVAVSVVAVLAGMPSVGQAGVVVTENQSASAWPETPDVQTNSNLALFTYPEAVKSTSTGRGRGQTFVATESGPLDKIFLLYSTPAATGTFQLFLHTVSNANLDSYTTDGSDNLFTSGLSFSVTVNTDSVAKILTLDFTGADEVTLTAGQAYAFEVVYTSGQINLYRTSTNPDAYADGRGYTNGTATPTTWNYMAGGGTNRDLGMALVIIPEPATMALLASGGALALIRRRRK
mgnify:FL=1